jgi:outer membrane receptor for ferrienterochelin and colicin
MVERMKLPTMRARSIRSHRQSLAWCIGAAALALGACWAQNARADEWDGDEATELHVSRIRFSAPPSVAERQSLSDVQWQHQGQASQWFARVSLGESSAPNRSLDGEVQWLYRGWDGQALTLGALVQRHLPPQGAAVAAADQRLGAYVNNEWQVVPGWRVVLGARADRAASGEQALAPRAALLWDVLPGLDAKLLDGVALREPGASLSPLRELVPQANASLGNERLRATELGLDWHAVANLRLAASIYRNEASQTSDAVVTGLSPGPLQFQNLGRANGNGIELGSEFVADAGWQVRGSWAASRAADGEAATGDASRTLARLQLNSPLPWRGARAGFEWWRMGPQGSAPDAQHLLNATVDWAPTGTPWTVAAGAYNLTGRTLADVGGTEPLLGALVRDGRRWQVQLARNF